MRLWSTFVILCSTAVLAQSPATNPARLVAMQHHFSQVFVAHEALIRGDLAAVRAPAAELSALPTPAGMSPSAAPYVAAIRMAGRQAFASTSLASAAHAVADMLTQCGTCHREVGIPVAVATPKGHDVGGIVGHMLEHQRAADEMLEGLIAPSASSWRSGAERLADARLLPDQKLPDDLRLLQQVQQSERRLHTVARSAAAEGIDAPARQALYAQIMTTCAECHSLHRRIWGPTRGRVPPGF